MFFIDLEGGFNRSMHSCHSWVHCAPLILLWAIKEPWPHRPDCSCLNIYRLSPCRAETLVYAVPTLGIDGVLILLSTYFVSCPRPLGSQVVYKKAFQWRFHSFMPGAAAQLFGVSVLHLLFNLEPTHKVRFRLMVQDRRMDCPIPY